MAKQTRHGQAPPRKNAMQKTSRCTPICTSFPRKRCKIQKNVLQKKKGCKFPGKMRCKKCVSESTKKMNVSYNWTLLWHFCAGAVINGSAQKCQNRVDEDRPCFATNPPSTKSIQVACITAQRRVETFLVHQFLPLHEATIHQEHSRSLYHWAAGAETVLAHQFSPCTNPPSTRMHSSSLRCAQTSE